MVSKLALMRMLRSAGVGSGRKRRVGRPRRRVARRPVARRPVRRRRVVRRRAVRRRRGGGFLSGLWNGIKKAANYVKDNKLISRGLALIPHAGAQKVGAIAGKLGLGRRRRVRRRIGGYGSVYTSYQVAAPRF